MNYCVRNLSDECGMMSTVTVCLIPVTNGPEERLKKKVCKESEHVDIRCVSVCVCVCM